MKIVLTGGHLTPAYAFAEIARQQGDQMTLIGSAGDNSVEARELACLGVQYQWLQSPKYDRYHRFKSLASLPIFIWSLYKARQYLMSLKPDVVVTFGSYNALPVGLAAAGLHIPLVTHEQTRIIGLTNRLLAPFATSKAVSYITTQTHYHDNQVMVTGNLLRSAIWNPPTIAPFTFNTSKPILYITGGNQGSQPIISAALPLITHWSRTYQIVIQSGKTIIDAKLLPKTVWIRSWFSASETAWMLHHARLVISRGGANTVAELMVAGVPAIIIPLPHTSGDEQTLNAQLITSTGAGMLLDQANLTPHTLDRTVMQLENQYPQYRAAAQTLKSQQRPEASSQFYQLVTKTVSHA